MGLNIPNEVLVWKFGGKAGNVRAQNAYVTNGGYNLFCATNASYLTYEKQLVGVNLGYEKSGTEHKVWVQLPDGQERDLLTGELFALAIGGGESFLKYWERDNGINLAWTTTPYPEWRAFLAGGEPGQPIPTGAQVALVNTKVKPKQDFLIYLNRVPGEGDIGWTSSSNWWAEASPHLKDVLEVTKAAIALL
jgi:hypothetical protein